jgi:hypothetical protein
LLAIRGEPPLLGWKIDGHHSSPFPEVLRRRLRAAAEGDPVGVPEIARLHYALGEIYAATVVELLAAADLDPAEVTGLGLSGQTIFHQSARESGAGGVTFQVGSPAVVAERTGDPRHLGLAGCRCRRGRGGALRSCPTPLASLPQRQGRASS